ncbi:uncharacterized protein PGTG_17051 [Puccinia graminis f. sp. tritici CRL 75-36-700-3]|uniref:Uncharacterized protein n=1 Tax=Puccinia graminis f. sp. tritici (strain CRL 75-36-700-3 / race SCCL) TaxID=418459 RepID=E3L2T6_PUCGT|nr:uncharacterized protein PGTG_17051 [Puccinia graminis f. sp. tritici CRL 75-36-700-3]EFP90852.2 hypothetical protein PGTG_17051 [Puccinia graminis f. sp. tritici CRL 75-36-700-3]
MDDVEFSKPQPTPLHSIPNPSEEAFVAESIVKIGQDNNGAQGLMPFVNLGALLNISPCPLLRTNEDTLTKDSDAPEAASAPTVVNTLATQTQILVCTESEEEKPAVLKRKVSGEYKIRLKFTKVRSPESTTEEAPKSEELGNSAKIEENGQPVSSKISKKSVLGPTKKASMPKAQIAKPNRAGTRSSTRKCLQI